MVLKPGLYSAPTIPIDVAESFAGAILRGVGMNRRSQWVDHVRVAKPVG
jgi:hypothetical protein